MKLESASITILVGAEGTEIEIRDETAKCSIVRVKLDPIQFSQALSRLAHTKCEVEVFDLSKIGKAHQHRSFSFGIPDELASSSHSEKLVEICTQKLAEQGLADWVPDKYFGSQNSFTRKNGQCVAHAIIRRWV